MVAEQTHLGGCACGAVRYEATGKPAFVLICHCRDCQRATGSTGAPNAWFPYAAIKYTLREPKDYVVKGASGHPVHREFCQICGSSVGMRADGYPDFRAVRSTSLDRPGEFAPIAEVWTGSKIEWDPLHPTLPKFEGNIPESSFAALLGAG